MERVTLNTQRGSGLPVDYRPRHSQAAADSLSARDAKRATQFANEVTKIRQTPQNTDRLELSKNSNKASYKFGAGGEASGSSSASGSGQVSRNRRMARMESRNIRVRNGRQLPVYFLPSETNNDLKSLSRKDVKKTLEGVNFLPKLDFLLDNCDHIEIFKDGGKIVGHLYDPDDKIISTASSPISRESKMYKPMTDVLDSFRTEIKEVNRAVVAHAEGREYEPSLEAKLNQVLEDFWEISLTGKTYRLFKNG